MTDVNKPGGWEQARLDDVAKLVRGITFPTTAKGHEPREGAVACLRTANVQAEVEWDDLWYVPRDYVKHEEQYVQAGDVLISTANSYELVGKVARVKAPHREASLGAFISLLRAESGICSTYFYYLMSSDRIQRAIREMASTTTNLSNISGSKLKEVQLPIAPTAEQTRIVEKLEELLSDLDAGVAELNAAQRKLTQYRQSLLKSAVEGALTADWRAADAQTKESQETGAELLHRILKERRARWETSQLARFADQGKTPSTGWQAKYPEPMVAETSGLPALPEGWIWATIDQIADVGTGVTPLRSKQQYFEGGTIPWVTSGALNAEVVTASNAQITPLALSECRLQIYPPGSLLVAMYGEGKTRGKCAELKLPATINQAIAALVLDGEAEQVRDYLKTFLLDAYEAMRKQASGGVQPNLNLQIIKSLQLPLPPLDEQAEIQRRLSDQLAAHNAHQLAIDRGLKQSAAQRKNILKAAFTGQLGPQDPNDEPAKVLLERIRAEREASGTTATRGRKPRATA